MSSIEEFKKYLEKINTENKQIDLKLGKGIVLNERQKQLIHYLLSEADYGYVTATSHKSSNNIAKGTAIRDLKQLEAQGLLNPKREGKFVRYYVSDKLKSLSEKMTISS